jgi:hypothetical protein
VRRPTFAVALSPSIAHQSNASMWREALLRLGNSPFTMSHDFHDAESGCGGSAQRVPGGRAPALGFV